MLRRLWIPVLLALGLAGWGLERLVVTDREAVESALARAASAVSHDDWAGLSAAIADDYDERGRDRAALVSWIRGLKERHRPRGVELDVLDPTVEGDHAAARVVVRPGPPYVGVRVEGRVDLLRTADGWRISGITAGEASILGR